MCTEATQRQVTTPHREGLEDSHLESAWINGSLTSLTPEPGPWSSGVAAPLVWDAVGPQEGDGDGSRSKDGKIFN